VPTLKCHDTKKIPNDAPQGIRKIRTKEAKICSQKEIIKVMVDNVEMETNRTKQRINEMKTRFFEKKKIDKHLAKLTKNYTEKYPDS
jgi:hypothetical protein